eukprot:GHVU01202311.1.p1 GENE.GHVU01202311.1~~GHVU01202311.1.p1  ORF type:complete len:179 (+),score=4.15 GHVU01202311.1:580-1116(+)
MTRRGNDMVRRSMSDEERELKRDQQSTDWDQSRDFGAKTLSPLGCGGECPGGAGSDGETHTHGGPASARQRAHTYLHTRAHTPTHTRTHTHTHTHARMHTDLHTRSHTSTHARTHTSIHARTLYTHAHYTHTHTNTASPVRACVRACVRAKPKRWLPPRITSVLFLIHSFIHLFIHNK